MSMVAWERAITRETSPEKAPECRANAALASLPAQAFASLWPHLKTRIVVAGDVLWDATPAREVYFPLSGIAAVLCPTADGRQIEVAKVGREAFVGLDNGPVFGAVLIGGVFACLRAEALDEAANRSLSIAGMVAQVRAWHLAQARQIAACNALHWFKPRLARWLIEVSCRRDGAILVTQQKIADELGVLRSQVTQSAGELRQEGAIGFGRGKIWITNPAALARIACDCADALGPAHWPFGRGNADG